MEWTEHKQNCEAALLDLLNCSTNTETDEFYYDTDNSPHHIATFEHTDNSLYVKLTNHSNEYRCYKVTVTLQECYDSKTDTTTNIS